MQAGVDCTWFLKPLLLHIAAPLEDNTLPLCICDVTPSPHRPSSVHPPLLPPHLWGSTAGVNFGGSGSHRHKRTDGNPHQEKTLFLLDWQMNPCCLAPALQMLDRKNVQGRVRGPNVKTQLFSTSLSLKDTTSPVILYSSTLQDRIIKQKHPLSPGSRRNCWGQISCHIMNSC